MQILSSEDYERLQRSPKGNWSLFAKNIATLQVGQHLLVPKTQWNQKTTPTTSLAKFKRKFGTDYLCEALEDKSGWVITRTK